MLASKFDVCPTPGDKFVTSRVAPPHGPNIEPRGLRVIRGRRNSTSVWRVWKFAEILSLLSLRVSAAKRSETERNRYVCHRSSAPISARDVETRRRTSKLGVGRHKMITTIPVISITWMILATVWVSANSPGFRRIVFRGRRISMSRAAFLQRFRNLLQESLGSLGSPREARRRAPRRQSSMSMDTSCPHLRRTREWVCSGCSAVEIRRRDRRTQVEKKSQLGGYAGAPVASTHCAPSHQMGRGGTIVVSK
jgi:hypothetical protein